MRPRCGLEWLYRLIQEPGRLWKRYLLYDLPFAAVLMLDAVLTRLGVLKTSTGSAPCGWQRRDEHSVSRGGGTADADIPVD